MGLLPADGLRPSARSQAVEPVVGFVVAVGLAVAGAGYWASWRAPRRAGRRRGRRVSASPYRLALRFERGTMRDYVTFSWPLLRRRAPQPGHRPGLDPRRREGARTRGRGRDHARRRGLAVRRPRGPDRHQTMYPAICAVADRTDLLLESFVKSNRLALMWAVPSGSGWRCSPPTSCSSGSAIAWDPAVVPDPGVRRHRGDQPRRLQLGRVLPRARRHPADRGLDALLRHRDLRRSSRSRCW